ncbi:MAG: hypothetical protein AAF590_03220 [Pseudomonadota bacterium]
MSAGIGFAILEMLAPGYVFLGFAIGAGIVGMALLAGGPLAWGFGTSLPMLLVVFSALSFVAWIGLRSVVGVRKGQIKTFDRDINED